MGLFNNLPQNKTMETTKANDWWRKSRRISATRLEAQLTRKRAELGLAVRAFASTYGFPEMFVMAVEKDRVLNCHYCGEPAWYMGRVGDMAEYRRGNKSFQCHDEECAKKHKDNISKPVRCTKQDVLKAWAEFVYRPPLTIEQDYGQQ